MPLTVGTAGHVDHGKTWLVRALTGKDTDRLPEERQRGMSIDLGYAPLELPGGLRVSLIDVPGHERFLRNMVAGATGIDFFLLVVDAREGPRTQTYEHLRILQMLGITSGLIAITKADAVEPDRLRAALEEARGLGDYGEPVCVSAKTGVGLDELRAALARRARTIEPRESHGPTRLFVDRAFTLRGIGTVVTGTLWSGSIGAGDELIAEPAGRRVRIRSVQVHDEDVAVAEAGQRVAAAIPRVSPREFPRGIALVAPGMFSSAYRLDVALDDARSVPSRVTAHHGTAETPARVRRRNGRVQLRLTAPLVAAPGDRVLLRTETTVGVAVVLDRPEPARLAEPASVLTAPRFREREPVHLPGGRTLEPAELERARRIVVAECERAGTITLAQARDLLGTSRRAAQAILERLDSDRVTLRIGDERRLRRRENYDRAGAAGPGGSTGLQNR